MNRFSLTEEQIALRDTARRFAREVLHPAAMRHEAAGDDFPEEVIREMSRVGLVGIDIPTEYGGAGLDVLSTAVVMEEICAGWFSAGSYAMSMAASVLLYVASEEMKRRYLPSLCRGESILTMALTEPEAGTDAGSLATRAERRDGGYVLNGTKIFITNAHRADAIALFARTGAGQGAKGISIFLLRKGTPGFRIGQRFRTLAHGANGISEMVLEDCFIPADHLLGEEGKGFDYILRDFAKVRAVYAARCVGVSQAALDYATQYAAERRQFGQPVVDFQANRFKVAELMTQIEAARCLAYRACAAVDDGAEDANVLASMAKNFAANVAMTVTAEAIQLMGGHGYTTEHPLERYYREAKLFQIGDGTLEALRLIISRHGVRQARAGLSARAG